MRAAAAVVAPSMSDELELVNASHTPEREQWEATLSRLNRLRAVPGGAGYDLLFAAIDEARAFEQAMTAARMGMARFPVVRVVYAAQEDARVVDRVAVVLARLLAAN